MSSPSDAAVIVCTRNRADMLRDALAAIAASTPAETEVLVVDSASDTPDTRRVAEEAGVGYHRAGSGLSVARNAGLTTTARPLVVFTDDDCLPTAGWIERLVAHFDDGRVAGATGRMLDHMASDDTAYDRAARYVEPLDGLDAGHGAVMAFRREVLLRLGGFDEVMGAGRPLAGAEDLDMFVRVLRAGRHIIHDATCIVRHANTRVGDAYVELHRGYGLGIGALVGKWLRIDLLLGARIGWVVTGRAVARLVRSRGRDSASDRALLAGIVAGVWRVRHLRIAGERFVPPRSRSRVPTLTPEEAAA